MSVRRELVVLFVLASSPLALAQSSPASITQTTARPLELRLAKPPQWKKSCLEISIERSNHSRYPIFLPHDEGIRIYSSVMDATDTPGQGAGLAWFSVYGPSDIRDDGLGRLGPNEIKRDDLCLWDTFPVDGSRGGRRQVRLQGSLRVYASFVLDDNEWRKQVERRQQGGASPELERIVIEIPIPCKKAPSKGDCSSPPPISRGEHHIPIPDIPQ